MFEKGTRSYRRCTGCGVVVALPFPTREELRDLYHREYAEPSGAGAALATEHEMALATARTRLRAGQRFAPGKRWLEVGCAAGAFLESAQAEGRDVEGIDISDVAVELARSRGLRARVLALEELQPTEPYDVVAAFDLIEHLPDPGGFLDQVRRVLRSRGVLLLTTPNTASFSARLMGRAWYFYIPFVHLVHFDRANLARMLEAHGFRVLHQGIAAKCLTYDYSVAQFEIGNPWLHALARLGARLLPRAARRFVFRVPIGEQFVAAQALAAGRAP